MVAEPWQQRGFAEALDEWIDAEHPDDGLRNVVTNWVLGRLDDPYAGLTRESGFENLWFGVIPGTFRPASTMVACSLWIEERTRIVRCDRIGTLSWPV